MTATGTYLYAITRPADAPGLQGLPGIGGRPVRCLQAHGLACLVSTVDLDEFGEQQLAANLNDPTWLERVAREHDSVIRAAHRMITAAPLRMATVCVDDGVALAGLAAIGTEAAAVLDRLDGRIEWGVQAFACAKQAQPSLAAAATSGTDYLHHRREEGEADATASAQAVEIYAALHEAAVDARRHRPQDPKLTGSTEPMLLNAAFLVERNRAEEFTTALDRLAESRPSIRLELSGPWPPYSFAVLEQAAELVEGHVHAAVPASLVDLLDRLLGAGVVLDGEVVVFPCGRGSPVRASRRGRSAASAT